MACRDETETVLPAAPGGAAVTPLEAWLAQDLHERWDGVANEPLPEELLSLLEAGC